MPERQIQSFRHTAMARICWIKTVFVDFPLYTNTVMILALNQKGLQNIFISCLGIAAIFIHSSLFQRLKIYWTIDWQAI